MAARGKKKVLSRSAAKTVASTQLGPEPVLSEKSTRVDLWQAYNWYNYMKSSEHAKRYILDWLKKNKVKSDVIEHVRKINEKSIPLNLGWRCRILTNGGTIPGTDVGILSYEIARLTTTSAVEDDIIVPVKSTVSIQKRIREKIIDLIAELEDQYDSENWEFNVSQWLMDNDVKPQLAQAIADKYKPLYAELYDAVDGKDPDIKEAYRIYKKRDLKMMMKFVENIIAECERRATALTAVKARKPRKRKEKPAAVQVANLQYKTDGEWQSVDPVAIVGASQLWFYNTKYKKLTVLNAMGPAGLSVKGTTVHGFNPKTSETRTLRKPNETIKRLMDGGKIVLRKLMEDLTTKPSEAKGRINTDVILLRVIK